MAQAKSRVLLIGAGGVGVMAAYALEKGGKAQVTAVLRSNYAAVEKSGFEIESCQWGRDNTGWRPAEIRKTVPDVVEEKLNPFDFVLVTTKNIPEISPTVADIIGPAITPGHTTIILSQNGLNIEKPIISRFSSNPVLSSISLISVAETSHGKILQDDDDIQYIGPFLNPGVSYEHAEKKAKEYISMYSPKGSLDIQYEQDVNYRRWRKLVYNASYNSVATVLRMDTARMRMSNHVIDDLIRPIMREIMSAAKACGVDLPEDLPEAVIRTDPTDVIIKPSMFQDIEKGNLIELENIVHEPLQEGESRGVAMPTLRTIYGVLKGLQLQTKESKGLWQRKFTDDNPYQ